MGMSLDFDLDLEKGVLEKTLIPISPDNVKTGEETVGFLENDRKEKRKKSASKPPRPPRGPSLDAADQKLIREIAELAMLKRARVERMRALKKSRAAKAASAASSLGNVLATLFTVIFFVVLVIQGFSPRAASSSGKSSLIDAGKVNGGNVSVYAGNPAASEPDGLYPGPVIAQRLPNSLLKPVSGLENEKKRK